MLRLRGGLGQKGAHGKKRRAFGVGQLELPRRFSVHREARAVNGVNGTGKTDGGDAVGGNRHGHDHVVIQQDLLNGRRIGQRNGGGEHRDGE